MYQLTFLSKGLVKSATLLAMMALVGCQSISQAEYEDFTPMSEDDRIMKIIQLTWEVRPDASSYCAQSMKNKSKAMMSPPIACAIWSAKAQTCTIVTPPNPNHVLIGHEVRHCFEGQFHP